MTRTTLAALCLAAVVPACSTPDRYLPAPRVEASEHVRIRFSSIEVAEVSLPTHASSEEIYVEAEGQLTASDMLWADDPTRAVTLALARNLTEITGARVAPAPWPFESYAGARVDVRVERFLATETGLLTLSGQYFVADLEGGGHDRARLFSLSAPTGDSAAADASARGRLVADLALAIAKDGLR